MSEYPPTFALARPSCHHVSLTVTDLDASMAWYEQLFSLSYRMEAPHEGGVGKLLADDDWSLIIILHRHDGNQGEAFHETRTGLDQLGFEVPNRAELEAWQDRLEELGVKRQRWQIGPSPSRPSLTRPTGQSWSFATPTTSS